MTRSTMSRRGVLGAVGAGMLAASGGRGVAADEELSGTINISTFKQTSYLAGYYLQRFAPPGVKINVVETVSNSDVIDALVTGNIHAGYMGGIACIIGGSRGLPIKAVASSASKTTRIMVRTDSPYRTLADLKGKSIGVAKATNQDIIFREKLREVGLDPKKDVDYILVPTPSQVEVLVNKTVEAVTTSEPNGSILLLSGLGREIVTDVNNTRLGNLGNVFAMSSDLMTKQPGVAQALVTLHAKTTVWMSRNTEELVRDFSKMARQREEVIRLAMSNTAFHYDIDDDYVRRAGILNESLVDANYLAAGYDIRNSLERRFLPQARTVAGDVA